MEPYLYIFALNLFLAYLVEKNFDNNKTLSKLIIVLIIIINTLFSGLRDIGVGLDTTIYIDSYFYTASSLTSFKELINIDLDKGYLILAYLASVFSDDSQSLLFATAFFINFFILVAFGKYRRILGINFFVATLLFCVIYYCHTLNLMRQYCAISLLTFGFTYFIEKKIYTYFFIQLIAFFLHSTSIFFIIIPLLWIVSEMQNSIKRNLLTVGSLFLFIIFIIFYFYFLSFFGDLGLVSEVYAERYGANGDYVNNTTSSGTGLGIAFSILFPIAFVYYGYHRECINSRELYLLIMLSILASLIELLGKYVDYVSRLAMYLSFFYYIFHTKLLTSKKLNILLRLLIIMMYVFTSYKIFVVEKGGDVIPYKSKILNIK